MNVRAIRAVANAILYEGYMLYPYRPSALKNRSQGWTFGTLLPERYAADHPGEPTGFRAEVIVTREEAEVGGEIRFLHLRDTEPVERTTPLPSNTVADLLACAAEFEFEFPLPGNPQTGVAPVVGLVQIAAERIGNVFKLRLTVVNQSAPAADWSTRDSALRQALVSAHALLTVNNGEFVSLLSPPAELQDAAAGCKQDGVFPVLAGEDGERTAMLVSPIILYDYPQIASKSHGDFFDSSEIDEMLTLRVLTLADSEKQEIRATSEQARGLLERTESLSPEDILNLHGELREMAEPAFRNPLSVRQRKNPELHGSETTQVRTPVWDPFAQPATVDTARVFGVDLRKGDRVRLWPSGRADILDIALKGKIATIEAIEQTFEGEVQLAVTVDDDPGRDLGEIRQIGHRFFFRLDEIEPVEDSGRKI